jgi:hypothetical protein
MIENELEASRTTETSLNVRRIEEIEKWFRIEYPARLLKAERYYYLGIPAEETRWDVEKEAYDKENELRILRGEEPLPALKYTDLL